MIKLKQECGVTDISLFNAKALVAMFGNPSKVTLHSMRDATEQNVIASWDFGGGAGIDHTFSGFSWGYGGEGPRGLYKFFRMIGYSIEMEFIAGLDQKITNYSIDVS